MDFKLPDIGEGVHEGEITKWLVKQGDKIAADQPMVEVMTDKATVEIPAPVGGVVSEVLAQEGQTIEVGTVIVRISENGKGTEKVAAVSAPEKPTSQAATSRSAASASSSMHVETDRSAPRPQSPRPPQAPAPSNGGGAEEVLPFQLLATPATRKLARDLSVDLKALSGTGPAGRITKQDVQLAYEGHQAATARPSHTQSGGSVVAIPTTRAQVPAVSRGAITTIPLKGIRKRIAEAMAHSKHTAAHFTYVEEVNMDAIVKLRQGALEEAKSRGIKLSFLPFILKALVPTLKEFPYLNASLDDEAQQIILKGDYNIGIATDTPNGLVVPVIKNVDAKSIWELAQDISDLSERARQGKSQLEDLRGGTFTVTNAGSIGGVFATPIINHPEVAILGVNAIRKRPIVKDDDIVVGNMMFLSMSVDHRVVDGADAARFMNRLIFYLSDPTRLVFA